MLEGYPKLVAIDEEADHQIVHGRRFRSKACGNDIHVMLALRHSSRQVVVANKRFCRKFCSISAEGAVAPVSGGDYAARE